MKAISKRQHTALITILQHLQELHEQGLLPCPQGRGLADGFMPSIQSLNEQFEYYEALIRRLAETIAEYEALHKAVRVSIVAPCSSASPQIELEIF